MGQGFQIDVFNNTSRSLQIQTLSNASLESGTFQTWGLAPQASLSQSNGGKPYYYELSGDTGELTIQALVDVSSPFQQVARVEFDSTGLENFPAGAVLFGSNVDISPGVPVPGTSNSLFSTLHLSTFGEWTQGTVIILEAVGANPDLP
jgi:hypothetical protein